MIFVTLFCEYFIMFLMEKLKFRAMDKKGGLEKSIYIYLRFYCVKLLFFSPNNLHFEVVYLMAVKEKNWFKFPDCSNCSTNNEKKNVRATAT